MNVMLTGSTGFVGSNIYSLLVELSVSVITPVRKEATKQALSHSILLKDLLELDEDLIKRHATDVFVHCAGLAHNPEADPSRYRDINTDLTVLLAERAASAGVKRFIFFSSIGVNGSSSQLPFKADDEVTPHDDYTESKFKAEQGLKNIAVKTGMEVVIIRPPLIYGAGAPGNFAKFVKLAKLPLPKPLGAIHNKRSFVSIDNLAEFTHLCLTHPNAANETFLVSDGEDLSTSDFLRKISKALGKPALLLPVPVSFLRKVGRTVGKEEMIDKLAVDLQVDIKKNEELLGWKPSLSVDSALQKAFSSL
ncbi:NAD-dependent epimerase/dehydratase family protein [Idiomarina abyssalis]|uniref:NAD-dependent epimerase/dehydratase family protein n=1 Tax=Idiomarina abyssalis TaxID=86102 RepID=UPI001C94AA87|nr:NAD-dependent epimerase/dehydratase family protein [Idiomarina abyssalis]QZN91423.1 NAD-dependent epimerase/dehydratase family protein [Idiomarina abyssalis]